MPEEKYYMPEGRIMFCVCVKIRALNINICPVVIPAMVKARGFITISCFPAGDEMIKLISET